jgi:hypothetical protein
MQGTAQGSGPRSPVSCSFVGLHTCPRITTCEDLHSRDAKWGSVIQLFGPAEKANWAAWCDHVINHARNSLPHALLGFDSRRPQFGVMCQHRCVGMREHSQSNTCRGVAQAVFRGMECMIACLVSNRPSTVSLPRRGNISSRTNRCFVRQ